MESHENLLLGWNGQITLREWGQKSMAYAQPPGLGPPQADFERDRPLGPYGGFGTGAAGAYIYIHVYVYLIISIFFFYLLMLMGALLGSIPIANQQPHPPSLCWNTTKSQSTWHLSLVQKWSHFFWIAVLLTQTYLSPRNLTLNAISKVSKMN